MGVADQDLLCAIDYEEKSSFLERVKAWIYLFVCTEFTFLQDLLLFGDWQLGVEPFGSDRQFFLELFLELSSFQMLT